MQSTVLCGSSISDSTRKWTNRAVRRNLIHFKQSLMRCSRMCQKSLTGRSTLRRLRPTTVWVTASKQSASWVTQSRTAQTTSNGKSGSLLLASSSGSESMSGQEKSLSAAVMKCRQSRCRWQCSSMRSTSRCGHNPSVQDKLCSIQSA